MCAYSLPLPAEETLMFFPQVDQSELTNHGLRGQGKSSPLSFPTAGLGNPPRTCINFLKEVRERERDTERCSQVRQVLHNECFCIEPHQAHGQLLWTPPGCLLAGPTSVAVQDSPVLPASPVAAESPPGVFKSPLPLALWAPERGKKDWDRGVGR